MTTFVKFMRSEAAEFLEGKPIANHVLSVIARRARRTPHQYNGLETGQCHMGDHAKIGISRQQYRTALANLQKWGFITINATKAGSVVTLINSEVYDLNTNDQPSEQPSANHQGNQPATNRVTTNKELKNLRTKEKYIPLVPTGVDPDLWAEYLKTRTKLKSPNTERAINTLTNKIEKLVAKGYDANELVETANSRGWKSVFEPRDNLGQANGNSIAAAAWENLVSQLHNWREAKVDEKTKCALRAMGGLQALATGPESALPFRRKDFMEYYQG